MRYLMLYHHNLVRVFQLQLARVDHPLDLVGFSDAFEQNAVLIDKSLLEFSVHYLQRTHFTLTVQFLQYLWFGL